MKNRVEDATYMRRALSLAMRGTGYTSPNPMVGCVIARDGEILGEGYHRRCGAPHAEREALRSAAGGVEGATAYVTLEPCSHHGKTPPCAPALVEAGIARCVVATVDPDPRVSGRGIEILRSAGVDVSVGVLEEECRWVNRGFIKGALAGMPWVTVKAALSLDGDMSLPDGKSKWITNGTSRVKAHLLRSESDAVMVGKGTVTADDPALTVRDAPGRSPIPVVIGGIDENRRVFLDDRCIIYTKRFAGLKGERLIPEKDGKVDLETVLRDLYGSGVRRLLVEGGGRIISSLLSDGLVDEVSLFVAPKIMGEGQTMTPGMILSSMEDSMNLSLISCRDQDGDLWLEGVFPCSRDLLRR